MESKRLMMQMSFLLMLCLVLRYFLSAGFAYAGPLVTGIHDSHGDFSESGSISINLSVLRDCPADAPEFPESRTVAQWINNRFYLWKEYVDGRDGEGETIFAYLVLPYKKALSAEESAQLLSASNQWQRLAQANLTRHARIYSPEVETISPQSVIGHDERQRIVNTIVFPFNCVGCVGILGAAKCGTAFLVSPHTALSCAHLIYDSAKGALTDKFCFNPGQCQTEPFGSISMPYGGKITALVATDPFFPTGNGEHDYGAAFFVSSFNAISTYLPLEFGSTPSAVEICGYPGEVQGETSSWGQWLSLGDISETTGSFLHYTLDTSTGNSGSPIWVYHASLNARRVVGIHIEGGARANTGVRLSSENQDLITGWMRWTPTGVIADSYEPDNDFPQSADEIHSGLTQDRSIHEWDDKDWARFTLAEKCNVEIKTDGLSGGDTEMWLYGPNGWDSEDDEIGYNDDYESGHYYSLIRQNNLGQGTYYVHIQGYKISNYTLDLSIIPVSPAPKPTPLIPDSYEPDDLSLMAKCISTGQTQRRNIHVAGDLDWATFTVASVSQIRAETKGTTGETEMWLFALDTLGVPLGHDSDGGNGNFSLIEMSDLSPGVYFLKVQEFGNDGIVMAYDLVIDITPESTAPDFDKNGSVNQSDLLEMVDGFPQNASSCDLNRDGDIDGYDLFLFQSWWGHGTEEE